jgi:hypothetical protein
MPSRGAPRERMEIRICPVGQIVRGPNEISVAASLRAHTGFRQDEVTRSRSADTPEGLTPNH